MFQLFENIKKCRMALVAWGRNLGNTKIKIEEKHKQLEAMTSMNTADNIELIQKVRDEIQSLLFQDELFWRQRSRSIWLSISNKNTKYFHQRASQRRWKNQIHGFLDDNGQWCTSETDTDRVAEAYFQNLFTTTNPTNLESLLDLVDRLVTPDMNHTLLQPYTPKEVKRALFQMHPSKSPGPDGMSPFFFQKYWHIIGRDVTTVVQSFFAKNELDPYCTYPKKQNESRSVSDYRPISLGNVVSRIVSKVLANRLKLILPNVISNS